MRPSVYQAASAFPCGSVGTMLEWSITEGQAIRLVLAAISVLTAVIALAITLAYRWMIGYERDLRLIMESIDKAAAERRLQFEKEGSERRLQFEKEQERWERRDREMLARFDKEAEARREDMRGISARFDKKTERRERDMREISARLDNKAEARREDMREILARLDKETERRERDIREIFARFDKEAAERQRLINEEADKRDRGTQAALERSDRVFEMLSAQSRALMKELSDIAQRTARTEATLEVMSARRSGRGSKSISEPSPTQ